MPTPLGRAMRLSDLLNPNIARNLMNAVPSAAYTEPYLRAQMLGLVFHGVSDPAAIRHVLSDNAGNYRRSRLVARMLRPLAREGLFTAEGKAWHSQRRLMAPAFLPHAIAAFTPLFDRAAEQSLDQLPDGRGVVDMAEVATRTTSAVIDEALFSGQSGMSFGETGRHVRDFVAGATQASFSLLVGLERFSPGAAQRRARRAQRVLTSRMGVFLRDRSVQADPPEDFVARLYRAFRAEHEAEEAMQLTLDNAMTFFIAGHETTAAGLTWALYLLSGDTQAQTWAREESQAAWAAGGGGEAVLERLPYLRMVWDETLRLYPPVHRIDREALADDEVCGHRVRKGETVTIWPWIVHRHRTLWDEPDLFNPENFDPEAKAGRHRYQFIPFGAGARMCVGMGFAQAEALILLSRWLAAHRFTPAPGHVVRPRSDFTLRPEGGLPLIVERVVARTA